MPARGRPGARDTADADPAPTDPAPTEASPPGARLPDDPARPGAPLYLRIKRMILARIAAGDWPRAARIPSENELVRDLAVSRMTVNRALRELTGEGVLVRRQGVGTFVASETSESALLEIRNIADDIRARGHVHTLAMVLARCEPATEALATAMGVAPGASVFHTICVHREDGLAVQLEDRFVNPDIVPDYLTLDFSVVTPTEVLSAAIPTPAVRHVIEAVAADAETARRLDLSTGDPCLCMTRTTWSGAIAVTHVRLLHPGARYRLSARFGPADR